VRAWHFVFVSHVVVVRARTGDVGRIENIFAIKDGWSV
jgi:hypothetical protein